MSFFRTQRAQVLRSETCRSTDIAVCGTFRRLGINPIVYVPAPSIPGAPSILSSTISGTSVTVDFTPAQQGGSPITNYQYSLDGGVTFTSFSPATIASPVTITGLTVGISYSVVLRAINSIGNGTNSDVLSVVIPTAPFAPTGLSGTTTGTTATITFIAGLNGGSPITNYKYSIDGGSTFMDLSPAVLSSPITISGLNAGTTYSVALRAVNAIGTGPSSATLSITTTTSAPPAPISLSSSQIGTNSVTVSFTQSSNGGNPITNYQYSTDGGSTFTSFSPAVTSSPVTITGLSSNTNYSIVLKPVNSIGIGASSSVLSVKTANIPGSLVFNGSNKLSMSPGVIFGTNPYTIECWFYNNNNWNTTASSQIGLLGCETNGDSGGLNIFFANNTTITTDRNGGGLQPSYTFANSFTLNAWHHFALVRDSNNHETVFIDGIRATSASGGTGTISGGYQINTGNTSGGSGGYSGRSDEIGRFYHGNFTGYLANFRIVVGTAIYDPTQSTCTIPTSALTNISGTKYLMVGDTVTHDGSSTQTITNIGGISVSTTALPL